VYVRTLDALPVVRRNGGPPDVCQCNLYPGPKNPVRAGAPPEHVSDRGLTKPFRKLEVACARSQAALFPGGARASAGSRAGDKINVGEKWVTRRPGVKVFLALGAYFSNPEGTLLHTLSQGGVN
jgi:hypothetical protein